VTDEINAVKNDIENSISDSISALETKINTGQEELRREISVFQERIKNMEAGQAEFEERVTRNLREDLSRNIKATRDLETQLAALEARTGRAGSSSAGTNADKLKPPKFDGSTSWVVFQRQFDAAAIHNDWTPKEKAAHLMSVLQGQAAHVLHCISAESLYEDIVGALRGRFGDHQLAAAYRSHLKARVQTGGETVQEFAVAFEQLAHCAFVGLPEGHIQTEAAHAFIDGMRDRKVKEHLLLGGACTLNDALNQAVNLEAAKATARLREVTTVPTGRPPTPPERRRNERPVCWECGRRLHFWKECKQRPPSRTRIGVPEPSIKSPRYAVMVIAEWAKGSLIADCREQEKPCRVTIDTGASATVARPDVVAGLPERELSQPYVLQTASRPGRALPRERTPGTLYTRVWVGHRAGLDTRIRGNILCPCLGTNPDRPVVQSLVRHYID
jgi:ribosomal protein L34E